MPGVSMSQVTGAKPSHQMLNHVQSHVQAAAAAAAAAANQHQSHQQHQQHHLQNHLTQQQQNHLNNAVMNHAAAMNNAGGMPPMPMSIPAGNIYDHVHQSVNGVPKQAEQQLVYLGGQPHLGVMPPQNQFMQAAVARNAAAVSIYFRF